MKARAFLVPLGVAALALGPLAALASIVAACSSSSGETEKGGDCTLASDCVPGLVCVEQENKTRICTDDVSRIVGQGPDEAGAVDGMAPAEAGGDGQTPGQPDTGSPGDPDTGSPGQPDTGSPVKDAAADG